MPQNSRGKKVGSKEAVKMEEEMKQKFGGFPYKPYSIQIDFMNALYDSLDKGGISMLESPTGNITLHSISICVCVFI